MYEPHWGSLLSIPDDVLANLGSKKVTDLVSRYLRRHVSGYDNDQMVYTVPCLDQHQLEKYDSESQELIV